jgi:hypothetical protein
MHVPGLDPGIDPCIYSQRPRIVIDGAAWMPGPRPGMTDLRRRRPIEMYKGVA